jgi:hypothetical protein
MTAFSPTDEILRKIWARLEGSKGLWSELEGRSYEAFCNSCLMSDVLIDLGFGLGRVTNLRVGHSCRVHAVLWSREAFSKMGEIAIALMNTANSLKLRRIECVVPSGVPSLRRYMKRLGFSFEGTMRSWYKGTSRFFDGDLYAVLF